MSDALTTEAPAATTTEAPTPSPIPIPTTESTPVTTSTDSSNATLLTTEEPVEAPAGPPETYEFTAPEGRELDPALLAEATPIFKELGLSQEGAQKLVDLYNKQAGSSIEKLLADQREVRAGWATESKAYLDTLPGGVKQAKADLTGAKNALFANPDGTPNAEKITKFNQFMDMTGAGDNPLFIEAFTKMAKLFNEGRAVTGTGPSKFGQAVPGTAKPSAAAALYPNLSGQ